MTENRAEDAADDASDVALPSEICPNCQDRVDADADECPTCGFDLSEGKQKAEESQETVEREGLPGGASG